MRQFEIAFCKKRTDTKYQNKKLIWSEFVDMLREPVVTSETCEEYSKMSKEEQGEIKDVGGFIAGYCKNGSRKLGDVIRRSMIALDIDDKATMKIIKEIETFATFGLVIYGTHKFNLNTPRCRIIIPLSRDVDPTEYEFLARTVADELAGIDTFDPTTFQVNRMMYLPSKSKDGDWYFSNIEGDFLNPDDYLRRFPNYRDTTTWPRSKEEDVKAAKKGTGKLVDPSSKNGVVGAFCACYSPNDAIEEFLSDIYKPGTGDRYTFVKGTSSNGLRIYDDTQTVKCEDATDPANTGTSINAFDLVRIHKFGNLDEGKVNDDTPINRYPSYAAMCKWAEELEPVKKELHHRALEELDLLTKPDVDTHAASSLTEDWLEQLTFIKRGKQQVTEPTTSNIMLILENDPKLKGLVGLDLFKDMPTLLKPTPWVHSGGYEFWTDADDAGLRIYLEDVYKLEARQKINDCLSKVIQEHAFHPVKQFIEEIKWDGIERVETLFIDYLGADDNEYVRTITRKALVAAVARIYEPGIKFDYMPILVGHQGIGKSLLIKKLGYKWTQDTIPDLKNQKMYEALDGTWLVEMGELAVMNKADRETIKMYITKTEDTYRKAYEKNISVNRRTCIFIGTTNESDFLNDTTGNRRFCPIQCHGNSKFKPWNLSIDEVHQIWAEAYEMYLAGEQIMDIPKDVELTAQEEQEKVTYRDDMTGLIEEWLDKPLPAFYFKLSIADRQRYVRNMYDFENEYLTDHPEADSSMVLRDRVCAYEVWCELMLKDKDAGLPRQEAYRINQILRSLKGWEEAGVRQCGPYGKQRCFKLENTATK